MRLATGHRLQGLSDVLENVPSSEARSGQNAFHLHHLGVHTQKKPDDSTDPLPFIYFFQAERGGGDSQVDNILHFIVVSR